MQRIFTLRNKQGVGRFMADLADLLNKWKGDKAIRVMIVDIDDRRSDHMFHLFCVWKDIVAKETGNDPDDVFEIFKQDYLTPVIKTWLGKTRVIPGSTKKQTNKTMTVAMEKFRADMLTGYGIDLPSPDDARLASLENR